MQSIEKVTGRQVLNSRGIPTVEAEVLTSDGQIFKGMAPSGESTGKTEAVDLRDGGRRFAGKGVQKAVHNVNTRINHALVGKSLASPVELDHLLIELDKTANKKLLGGNATTAVSFALWRASAHAHHLQPFELIAHHLNKKPKMPVPWLNFIEAGVHAGFDHSFQEHLLAPVKAKDFEDAVQISVECYLELKHLLVKKYGAPATLLAAEGGFAPLVKNTAQRLDLIMQAAEQAGHASKIALGLDCAGNELVYKPRAGTNTYKVDGKVMDAEKLAEHHLGLIDDYPIQYIEDPFAENEAQMWVDFTEHVGKQVQVVADDLTTTNASRVLHYAHLRAANSMILKVNQVGTVTETLFAANAATHNNWQLVVSHRGQETEDPFIAHLAVALGQQTKFGAPARSERTAKYNELLRISELL